MVYEPAGLQPLHLGPSLVTLRPRSPHRRNEVRAWANTGYTMLKRQSAQDPRKWVSLEPARGGSAIAGTASK